MGKNGTITFFLFKQQIFSLKVNEPLKNALTAHNFKEAKRLFEYGVKVVGCADYENSLVIL